jgi:type I restriction enzyme S subunit
MHLRRMTVYIPPIREQQAIACILGTLDDKIELNRRMNETLEGIARAIFKSWFVDFDPVRAKLALSRGEGAAGQQPASLAPHIADLFPDAFEESELGEIPRGWTVKTVDDVAERVGMGPFGSSIKVETFVPEGVPIISGQHLRGFMLEDNTFNFITNEHASRLKSAMVRRGDVIFTHAGNIGQVAYIPENSRYERYVISQRQFFMRCDLSQVSPVFVAMYFKSPRGQHQLLANTSSSGVPSIARPVTHLRAIQLPIPQKPVLDAFEATVQPLLLRFRQRMDESCTLAALRNTLLPKLISGELCVPDAERFVAEVL